MKWLVFIQLAFAVAVSSAAANVSYIGRVFEDRDADGVFGKGDRPLPGVMVSDGLNVVPAGNDGMFSLPHRGNARFIFVTTPSGYMAAEAYYMKTGTQAETYDFPLVPYDAGIRKDGSHTFIQVTDTEIFNTDNNEEWADNIRQCATVRNAAFIVHTGDICYEKGLESHIGLMNTENMGVPVYYGIGNHDLVKGRYGEELFESIYGPAWYSFDVAGTHYVMLPMLYAQYLLSKGMNQAAIPVLWQVLDIDPTNNAARMTLLGEAIRQENYPEIIRLCEAGVEATPNMLEYYFYLAIAYNHDERTDDALSICRRALKQVTKDSKKEVISDFYSIIGDAYHEKMQMQEAYAAYDSALVYNPSNIATLNNYAYYLSLERRDLDKAEEMSYKTIKAEPNNATYLDTYAWILFEKGNYAEARIYIDNAMLADGEKSSEVVEHCGDIYYMTGDVEGALKFWQQALEMGSTSPTLKEKIAQKKYIPDETTTE